MQQPQSYAHHASIDPVYHFGGMIPLLLAMPLSLALVAVLFWKVGFSLLTVLAALWVLTMTVGTLLAGAKVRLYALKVQDRVIALEVERRYERLGGRKFPALSEALKPAQLVGLRFAADEELVALAEAAAAEELPNKEIKKRIKTWRPDYRRI